MMIQLPKEFIHTTKEVMGEERFERYLHSFEEETPVSIRLNPIKMQDIKCQMEDAVPWCRNAFYLAKRPNFTFDPLFHAGCYYVQEAASMFLDEVLKTLLRPLPEMEGSNYTQEQLLSTPLPHREGLGVSLDLCAAPGGKTTCAMSALPSGSRLYSNEPIRTRAHILSENVQKFGHKDIVVTNNYPKDYRKSGMMFDVILCDVPCSGEGMFRKDKNAINEWSLQHVAQCQQLQRNIVEEAWQCLRPGGLLIYSTCTFNVHENEENVKWIYDKLGAKILCVEVQPEWGITGSLLNDFQQPVYRFLPGFSHGEGLFMAVMTKCERVNEPSDSCHNKASAYLHKEKRLNILPPLFFDALDKAYETPKIELPYAQAISYLRRESIILSADIPCGIVTLTYHGLPIGLAKNVGNRANNLYPKEWRIKSTHIPQIPVVLLTPI
jgi:16S rRNA C967 or C1407 C5-methylase (RsmB/RsmF family)